MKHPIPIRRRLFLTVFLCLGAILLFSQKNSFGKGPVKWELRKPQEDSPGCEKYKNSDLIILKDFMEVHLYSEASEKLVRNVKYKINTQEGVNIMKLLILPESFEEFVSEDGTFKKQNVSSRIPDVIQNKVKVFAARKFSNGHWTNVNAKEYYVSKTTTKPTGEFIEEDLPAFKLLGLKVGDVLELYYEIEFNSKYGTNTFYFNGPYPKLSCEYNFVLRQHKHFHDMGFVLPLNVDSSLIRNTRVDYNEYYLETIKIKYLDLKANTYPLNSMQNVNLPHVYVDFSFYRSAVSYSGNQYFFSTATKPKNFKWKVLIDTSVKERVGVYDKKGLSLKKFIETLPPLGNDTQNIKFLKALNDTLNAFRFLTSNHLFYNESNLYYLSSAEHLAKRRLVQQTYWRIYQDLLNEAKLFYFLVNVQDKRLGEHRADIRAHYSNEHNLIAVPLNEGYVLSMPRHQGLSYHLNEIPFYYENSLAAFIPVNFQRNTPHKTEKTFKLGRIAGSTYLENQRLEKGLIKINLDSLTCKLSVQETLSGQFSTLLRPLYLNRPIDSTVSSLYFRKCLDKPNSIKKHIQLVSKNDVAPFQYAFDCSTLILLKDTNTLVLKDWFSFIISKKSIPTSPNFDYYFDFEAKDSYEYLLEFNKPVELKNRDSFNRNSNNEYYEFSSEITKREANKYVLKVEFTIKQNRMPIEQVNLLMDLLETLDQLNNFTLEFVKG